jgi:hypothetical protein
LLGSDWAAVVGEVTLRATNSGKFLVLIGNYPYCSDAASGTNVLTLAKTGDAVVATPGDEGWPLTGAGVYNGSIPLGDIDLGKFTTCAGELIDVRVDEIAQTNSFDSWVRLYGPNGLLLGSSFGTLTARGIIEGDQQRNVSRGNRQ